MTMMMLKRRSPTAARSVAFALWTATVVMAFAFVAPDASAQTVLASEFTTWDCTGADCPWGASVSGEAAAWPAAYAPVAERLGYTTTPAVYMPAAFANGSTVTIEGGGASLYAGPPQGAHRLVATLAAGQSHDVVGLATDEVLSLQAGSPFAYSVAATPPPDPDPDPPVVPTGTGASSSVTWSCMGTNCPSGASVSGEALAWPIESAPVSERYDYITSLPVYLPAAVANGVTVRIDSGSAGIWAGPPNGAHANLANLAAGETFDISGVASGDLVSVQSGASFTFTVGPIGTVDPADPDPDPGPGVPPVGTGDSSLVTWNCTGSDCPWGPSVSGDALAWPAESLPDDARLGYTTSFGIYLPAATANGVAVRIDSGAASVYAGPPDGTHRVLATLTMGQVYEVNGLVAGEVLSVQSGAPFSFTVGPIGTVDPVLPPPPPMLSEIGDSSAVTWTCTGTDCPWGSSLSAQAVVWPAEAGASAQRYGYDTSAAVYVPAAVATGMRVSIGTGYASIYVGTPYHTDSLKQIVYAGGSYVITGISPGDVVSIESEVAFTYSIQSAGAPDPGPVGPDPDPDPDPGTGDPPIDPSDIPDTAGSSASVTWTCTGSNCPWGASVTGEALVWPVEAQALATRYDYDTGVGVYLPGNLANGMLITIDSGSAVNLFVATSIGTDQILTTLSAGESYVVNGIAPTSYLSVEATDPFTYSIEPGSTGDPGPIDPIIPPPVTDPSLVPPASGGSVNVTWTCGGTLCPWGTSVSSQALVWPPEAQAFTGRYDYETGQEVYLPAELANGMSITITSGSAVLLVGTRQRTDDTLQALDAGETYVVTGLEPGEVLSVESAVPFSYSILPFGAQIVIPEGAVGSVPTFWYCNTPGCYGAPWTSQVIDWPEWAAYSSNGRSTPLNSRTTYDSSGELLHPYMGAWADGCIVTAEVGLVLIIEWERGQEVWRETWLDPGETHVIDLVGPENGAMIETYEGGGPFAVTLQNCEPQPIPPDPFAP